MKKGIIATLSLLAGTAAGAAIGASAVGKLSGEATEKAQNMSDKHLALYLMMTKTESLSTFHS